MSVAIEERLGKVEKTINSLVISIEAQIKAIDMITIGGWDEENNIRHKGLIEQVQDIREAQVDCIEKHRVEAEEKKVRRVDFEKWGIRAILSAIIGLFIKSKLGQ